MLRLRMMRGMALLAVCLSPRAMVGQFVTPVPITRDPRVLDTIRYQARFGRSLPDALRDSIKRGQLDTNATRLLAERRTTFCTDSAPAAEQSLCKNAIDVDVIREKKSPSPLHSRWVLRPGILHPRDQIENYLRESTGSEDLKLFSRFAANIAEKNAYVVTDVISGLAGRAIFAINYAAVVVKEDAELPLAERRTIEDQKSTIIRMVNNGGTLTGRFQLPVHAMVGPTFQSASSVYGTFGLIGPTGNTDSLAFAGSAVAELSTALSIREPGESAGLLGSLALAGRIGYAFSENELLGGTNDKGFPFAQVAVGLLQNGKVSLSALVTWPLEDKYRPFAPKLVLNLAAIR